jgi:hypothetical protein
MDISAIVEECQRLAENLLSADILANWRVVEAHVRLGATGDNVGVFTCRLEPKLPTPSPSGIGTTRAMPIGELRDLLREQPRELLERIFAPTSIS